MALLGTTEELGREAAASCLELVREKREPTAEVNRLAREAERFRTIAEVCGVAVTPNALKVLDLMRTRDGEPPSARHVPQGDYVKSCPRCGKELHSGGGYGRHLKACTAADS